MKLLSVLLMAGMLHVTAYTSAQKVTCKVHDMPLKQVFKLIQKQTGYYFIYSEQILDNAKKVTVNISDMPLSSALDLILKNTQLKYRIEGNSIILTLNVAEKTSAAMDTTVTIIGTVSAENASFLPGATVQIRGTGIGTSTNVQGQFTLKGVPLQSTLIISYTGFLSQQYVVRGTERLVIQLKRAVDRLDETVIIGYGSTTKRYNTGNISTIRSEVIANQPVTNPLQALTGRVPGMQIVQSSGLPGAAVKVQIRGQNSIAASNNPLYIIDGVPFSSSPVERMAGINSAPTGNAASLLEYSSPLNTINPEIIERIEILKDADATSIYGSRASNGVILITTKKGQKGKPRLEVNTRHGFGQVTRMPRMLNTAQYLQLRRDALANSNIVPSPSNAPELFSWDQQADFNWQDWYLGGTARTTDAGISLSGGDGQISFSISGNYHHETTILPGNTSYKRGGMHTNITYRSLNNKLTLTTSVFYNKDDNKLSGAARILPYSPNIIRQAPNFPVYDSAGNYNWPSGKINWVAQSEAYAKSTTDNLNAGINVSYELIRGLSLKANMGYNKIQVAQNNAYPLKSLSPAEIVATGGKSDFSNNMVNTLLFEPQVFYTTKFLKANMNVLAGATLQDISTRGQTVNLTGYTNDLLLNSMNFGIVTNKNSNSIEYRYLSLFGRMTFNWDGKYILNGTIRRDGSTRFGPGKQFGTFGSVGAAWIFTNEPFLYSQTGWLSFGKLRGSWGTTGNDGIGDFGYLSLYSNATDYGSTLAIIPSQVGNEDYQWEMNRKLEAALELGFLKDRILFTAAWYMNRSGNQLVGYPLPSTTGFSTYTANLPALVENTGCEFESFIKILNKDRFKWETNINVTIPKNTLLRFPNLEGTSYANSYVIGKPLSILLAYEFIGTDPLNGLTVVRDIDHNGTITARSSYNNQGGDYIIAGNTAPYWFAGMGNTVSYKSWQLDIFLQYTKQDGFNLNKYAQLLGTGFDNPGTNVWTDNLNYWRKPGDGNVRPKPLSTPTSNLRQFENSDQSIGDASFLRLKTVALSYNLPDRALQTLKIKSLRLFLQGQNILTITSYKGYDPENAGLGALSIPPLKQFSAGIQCTL